MCIVKIYFLLWVAMETVRFHIAQICFFLEDITHLVGQSEQLSSCEKLFWGFKVG